MKTYGSVLAVLGLMVCSMGWHRAQDEGEKPAIQELVEISFKVKDPMKMTKPSVARLKAALHAVKSVKITQSPEAPEYGYTEGRDSGPMQLLSPGVAEIRLAVPRDSIYWWSQLSGAFSKAALGVDESTLTAQTETRMKLSGLVCDNCKKALTQKLQKLAGFGSADIDIKSDKEAVAVIRFDRGTPTMAQVRAAVASTPFKLEDVSVAGNETAAPEKVEK